MAIDIPITGRNILCNVLLNFEYPRKAPNVEVATQCITAENKVLMITIPVINRIH